MGKPESYVTYRAVGDAPVGQRYIAYIHAPEAGRLNMAFFSDDEESAAAKAKAFWDQYRAEREANIASREAARIKAAATIARKTDVSTARKSENQEA